jgi:hypothetical protein
MQVSPSPIHLSKLGLGLLRHEKVEPLLTLNSLLAEAIVGAEPGGVCVQGVRAVFEGQLHGVHALAIGVQVVSEVHQLLL